MKLTLTFKFNKAKKNDLERYENQYRWFSELSSNGKKEAAFQIKKFEDMGVAIPTGLIYNRCISL